MSDKRVSQQDTDLDRRETPRFVLLLRPAKVLTSSGEYLCILRDVASKGVRLRLFHALPPDPFMTLELANGDRYEMEKVWEREEQACFNFVHRAELQHLLEERSRFRKRPVRARIELAARLNCGLIVAPFAAAMSFGGLRRRRPNGG